MAGRYLIERGHREIGVIPGPLERNTGAGRLAGFMKAMEEAMIKVPESWIVQGDFEPESGYRAMQQTCRSRIALLPSSVVAISWQWAHFVLLMKWACASRRMFR